MTATISIVDPVYSFCSIHYPLCQLTVSSIATAVLDHGYSQPASGARVAGILVDAKRKIWEGKYICTARRKRERRRGDSSGIGVYQKT